MRLLFFLITQVSILVSCNTTETLDTFEQGEREYNWTVPKNTITGKFNPFSLSFNPSFIPVNETTNIENKDLVAVISFDNEIRVYPYKFISFFECINDTFNSIPITITYCPRTQSAICFERQHNNKKLILRASGFLRKDNLVAYDSVSDTYWSQMALKCIKGKYADEKINTYNTIETTWKTVKDNFPNAFVFENKNVKSKKKSIKNNIIDGDKNYGIISNSINNPSVYIYKYSEFDDGIKMYQKFINHEKIIIIGSNKHHFITSFINNSNLNFTAVQNKFPVIMKDNIENLYNMFGVIVSGPNKNSQLTSPPSYVALGWAWKSFYSNFNFTN